jgi:hypothetical protein
MMAFTLLATSSAFADASRICSLRSGASSLKADIVAAPEWILYAASPAHVVTDAESLRLSLHFPATSLSLLCERRRLAAAAFAQAVRHYRCAYNWMCCASSTLRETRQPCRLSAFSATTA